MTLVPNGMPVSELLSIYPNEMTISAYGRKLGYQSFINSAIGYLWDIKALEDCAAAVTDAKGVECDEDQLNLRITCVWAN